MGLFIFRFFIIGLITIGGYFYPPFKLNGVAGAAAAFFLGALMMYLETRVRKAQFRVIWSAGMGLLVGILLGWMLGAIYQSIVHTQEMATFIRIFFLAIMPYIGILVGTRRGARAFRNLCPHVPIPLDRARDEIVEPNGRRLCCSMHGALFDPVTGLCTHGPCAGERLQPLPLRRDGDGWALDLQGGSLL